MNLNQNAAELCQQMLLDRARLRIAPSEAEGSARLIDCGVDAPGGLEAGRRLAEVCLAGLARVELVRADPNLWPGSAVMVTTDHPVAACMASQYAGWKVEGEGFFAIGSGPMRAAAGEEDLFDKIGCRETAEVAVGTLECGKLPPAEVCRDLAEKCRVAPDKLTLLVAPVTSQAGTFQVVARSVETALHKLLELGFDLSRVESGVGTAPLPPVAGDELAGIGRTNDAILYGGEVTLFVRGDDASLADVGAKVPSSASPDHGLPFAQIFEKHGRDFYQIDPHLFSPAVVRLENLDTGNSFKFGHTLPRVIHESFG